MVWRNPSQATRMRTAKPDDPQTMLERSNTSTTFSTFFFGRAAQRNISARRTVEDEMTLAPSLPYLYPRAPAPRTLALRASKLVQVEKLPRDERITAWQDQREEELGATERWRLRVAEELEREEAERRTSTGIAVRRAVGEIQGLLETSPFSTSFTIESLALPTSPVPPESPGGHIDPLQRLSASESSIPSHAGEVTTAQVVRPITATAAPTAAEFPTPPSHTQPHAARRAHPNPLPVYRFPAASTPLTPPFPSLTRIPTEPATPATLQYEAYTVARPPRSSSLPFTDLLHAPLPASSSPSPAARAVPPQCGLVPPKAAALLGLLEPVPVPGPVPGHARLDSDTSATHGGSSAFFARPRARWAAAEDAGAGCRRKYSLETETASSSLFTRSGAGRIYTATGGGASSLSSLAGSVPTSVTTATGAKLSLDLTRGTPRLVPAPVVARSGRRNEPRLVLRQAGMSSLPDLYDPSSSSSALAHKSVYPPPPAPWAPWDLDGQEQEELEVGSQDGGGSDESAVDAFEFPPVSRFKRTRRKSSFRCRGQRAARIEVGGGGGGNGGAAKMRGARLGAAVHAPVRELVRTLSRSSSRAGGLVRALSGRRVEGGMAALEKRVRRKTRDEWEMESALIGGRLKQSCCL